MTSAIARCIVGEDAAPLRLGLRVAGSLGLTIGALAGLEAERALLRGQDDDRLTYKWASRWGRAHLALYGVEVVARGRFVETEGGRYPSCDTHGRGRLFVTNHRSMLDTFVHVAMLDAFVVSRADLARWPVIGLAARRAGTLFVERSSKRSGAAVIDAMCAAIERGRGVLVYCEGGTTGGDIVREFRPGAFVVAKRTGAEVVPVGLAYEDNRAAYGDETFSRHLLRVSSARGTRVALVVGEPLQGPHADVDVERERARRIVQELVRKARDLLQRGRVHTDGRDSA